MKRILCLFLLTALVLSLCAGCNANPGRRVSCDEVIRAYEEAGYEVSHRDYPEREYGYLCEVTIEEEDGDSIRFHFYETDEEAEAEAEERQWNWALWMFSVIYSDPTWLETETHYNIEIEYDDDALIEPFRKLVKE